MFITSLLYKKYLFETVFPINQDIMTTIEKICSKFENSEIYKNFYFDKDISTYKILEEFYGDDKLKKQGVLTNNKILHNELKTLPELIDFHEPKTIIHEKYIKEGFIIAPDFYNVIEYRYKMMFKMSETVSDFLNTEYGIRYTVPDYDPHKSSRIVLSLFSIKDVMMTKLIIGHELLDFYKLITEYEIKKEIYGDPITIY